MKTRILFTALLIVIVAAFSASPAAARNVFASNGCGDSIYKPVEVVLTCGDADLRLIEIEWTRWDSDSASGMASISHPLLTDPSCKGLPDFACPIVEHPATVTLSRPVYCGDRGRWQFTRLRAKAPEDEEEQARNVRRSYHCSAYAKPRPPKPPFWRNCGQPNAYTSRTVVAHRVPCSKARRVIRGFQRLGQQGGPHNPLRVKSFSCVIQIAAYRPIACSRGSHLIRGSFVDCGFPCRLLKSPSAGPASLPRW